MKGTAILAAVGALAIGVGGYEVMQHSAERVAWQAERETFFARIDELEGRVAAHRKQLEAARARRQSSSDLVAAARLGEIEAQIFDSAARLAELESDRVVAEDRADAAFAKLGENVHKVAEIERDVKRLGDRRFALNGLVAQAEGELKEAYAEIADRRKQAKRIDHDIAALAIRREAMRGDLDFVRRSIAAEHDRMAALEAVQNDIVAREEPLNAAPAPRSTAEPEVEPASIAVPVDGGAEADENRDQGLYQFKQLVVAPADAFPDDELSGDLGPLSAASNDEVSEQSASDAWAEQQYKSALVLMTTAERNSGTRELNEAALALKAVLGEWPRARDPLRWAIARNDLGYALALLGQRTEDVGTLEDAARASREALAEFKRGETPILWAGAQHYLGVSLSGLAAIKNDKALWENAIEALQQSVEVFEENGAMAEAAKATRRLEDAQASLAAWQS